MLRGATKKFPLRHLKRLTCWQLFRRTSCGNWNFSSTANWNWHLIDKRRQVCDVLSVPRGGCVICKLRIRTVPVVWTNPNNSRQPRECVCVFYLRTESPDTIPVQLFRASALASWPHWHNLSALSGLSARSALAIKYASEYNKLLKCLSLSAQQIRSRFQWKHRTTNCTANQIRAE